MSIRTDMRGSTSTITRANRSPLPDIIGLGGAVAGLGGGLAMALAAALIAASRGGDIWLEAKQIADPLFGAAVASQPGFVAGPVIAGTLIHLFLAALLGATYSVVTRRILQLPSDFGTPVLAGMVYGLIIWMLAYFVILPMINPALLDMYAPAFIAQHLIYGTVTGLLYTYLRPMPFAEYRRT